VWVEKRFTTPLPIYRVDLGTGQRTLWKELAPRERAGYTVNNVVISRDGTSYAFQSSRRLSALFLVEGLH
jgi:hypothetical protein